MKKGKLLIISGFSGVGKGTVVKHMLENYEDYKISVSATTREPRAGEENGIHYHFLTKEQFENMIAENQLLEHANYVGNYYGTPKDFVEKTIEQGENVILEIETQGAIQVKEKIPEAIMVFILPPSAAALKERLVGRKSETAEVIAERLTKAAEETKELEHYEYFVINDEVEKCADDIDKIVRDNYPELISSELINKIKKEILMFSKGE